ncbi:hypothetical protein CROQUDRAFT_95355 [Cronartium quercuum f. sp. fusiforme G11]|uniref:Uncharacterized protein n=1 Tax=Cronartium quercuum f. sp. fusiforme G11 TaxID=708437 RepID=A0A9P6TA12_9BASI|nr:hypothetical protein CROQUDRAFT_95355 [Cronartium quercuum f. sp. fusiforme G11]
MPGHYLRPILAISFLLVYISIFKGCTVKLTKLVTLPAPSFQVTIGRHNTASPSAQDRLDAKLELGAARLLTLPDTNPAGILARKAKANLRARLQSSLHRLFRNPVSALSTKVPCANKDNYNSYSVSRV